MCISQFTQIPVNVGFCRGGPRRACVRVCGVCACVRVCVRVCTRLSGEIAVWCVTPDYGYTFPSFSPCALQINVMQALVWAPDRQTSAEGFGGWWQRRDLWWRPPFCHCRLAQITPQRHLLTLYANETERGSNEKRLMGFLKKRREKKKKSKREKRNRKGTERICVKKSDMKQPIWMCLTERNKRKRTKTQMCVNIGSVREVKNE